MRRDFWSDRSKLKSEEGMLRSAARQSGQIPARAEYAQAHLLTCHGGAAARPPCGAVVVVPGDAGGRRQQHGHHGGPADHAERAFAEPGPLAMGGQCLSGRLLGLHRAPRPRGGRLASLAGLALFALASCIIATAATQTALLAGRSLQGLAAAFAVPSTLAAVDTSAAPERRGAAIGAWTGFLMLGFSIGPLLGG